MTDEPTPEKLLNDAIRSFAVFARHLNFRIAADELAISQPALHTKVRKLADALKVDLYEREPNGNRIARLTPQGLQLQRYAQDANRLAQDSFAAIKGEHAGPLVIAAGRGAYLYVIGDAIKRLSARQGGIRVTTANNDDAVELTRRGAADVAVLAAIPPPDDMEAAPLGSFSQVLVIRKSHKLASRTRLRTKDILGLEFVLPARGEPLRENMRRSFQEHEHTLKVEAEALNWDLLVKFVEFGVEATIVNDFVPVPETLAKVELQDLARITYHAIWRTERTAQADELLAAL